MLEPLPRLRMNLDFMPSPMEDRPGLLIRDSYGYSDAVMVVPPALVACLEFFDGERTHSDLREFLVRLTGELNISPVIDHLQQTLSSAGFLDDEVYARLREERLRDFYDSAVRVPTHAGSAYPGEEEDLRATFAEYLRGGAAQNGNLIGIAAPHVSPFGGWQTYRSAYGGLSDAYRDRTFVVLGTSHYGEPDRFGLTRKPFATPYGTTRTASRLIDELETQPAVLMEDYCHAIEHSIEFQVVFLQHLYGPEIEILPILCGSFARSILMGGLPEDSEPVKRFFGALGEMSAREGDRLHWVLGIDMAHMGARYGDDFEARAGQGEMVEVEQRDRRRIERVIAGDASGFWEQVQENQDDLKWCGSSPVYTFMKAHPGVKGSLNGYEQWNIDECSVVSFAALSFEK